MKLHLPVRLFRFIVALSMIVPSQVTATYTVVYPVISDSYSACNVEKASDIVYSPPIPQFPRHTAWCLTNDIRFTGYGASVLPEVVYSDSVSWIFTSAVGYALKSITVSDCTTRLFAISDDSWMSASRKIQMQALRELLFTNNSFYSETGAAYGGVIGTSSPGVDGLVELSHNQSILAEGNAVKTSADYGGAKGGAIAAYNLNMDNNGELEFTSNSANGWYAYGGAVYAAYKLTLDGNESIAFVGNEVFGSHDERGEGGALGGAICVEKDDYGISICNNRVVSLKNNKAYGCGDWDGVCGGAIYCCGDLTMSNNAELYFEDNAAMGQGSTVSCFMGAGNGGAIYVGGDLIIKDTPKVIFVSNLAQGIAQAGGGAVDCDHVLFVENCNIVDFSFNEAIGLQYKAGSAAGGAVCGSVSIKLCDEIRFINNLAEGYDDGTSAVKGGAIYGENLTIQDSGYISFVGNEANCMASGQVWGGAVSAVNILIKDNADVLFDGNSASSLTSTVNGGCLYGKVVISGNDEVVFKDNSGKAGSWSYGGAVCGGAFSAFGNESLVFLGNTIASTGTRASADVKGGAIYSNVDIHGHKLVQFSNNRAESLGGELEGGAICIIEYSEGKIYDNHIVIFENNVAQGRDTDALAGAMSGRCTLLDNGIVVFKGNQAKLNERLDVYLNSAMGGALYSTHSFSKYYGDVLTIVGNDDVQFIGNSAVVVDAQESAYGGAIYNWGSDMIVQNNLNVLFEKNYEAVAGVYRLRSLYAKDSEKSIILSAPQGKSIEFRDSMYIGNKRTVLLNSDYVDAAGAVHKQTGDIIFSGKYTEQHLNELLAADRLIRTATEEEILNSRTTEVNTMTNLYGGRLRVEDGAIYKGAGITTHADTGASVWLRSAQMQHAGYNVNIARGTGVGVCGINFCSANLTLADGCYLSFDIGGENMTSAVLTHIGNLTLGSTITLNIGTSDAELQKGSYQLMRVEDSTAISGWGEVNFVIKSGEFTLSDLSWVENTLCFNYTGQKLSDLPDFTSPSTPECPEPDNPSPDIPPADGRSLTWANAKKAVWQDGAAGWVEGGVFSAGDEVTFADGNVTIVGEVEPGEVTINTQKSLAFKTKYDKKTQQYSGAIAGETSVTIDAGPKAKVTMNDGNTYSGGTIIEGGSVKAGGATSFGTGTITLNGGTLDLAGKAVDNAIALEGTAIIKGGAKYTGDFSMGRGADLMKGSVVNVAGEATISGGSINGTLSGPGTVEVAGDVLLGTTGKLTLRGVTVASDAELSVSSKGLALSARNSTLTVNGGVVDSEGKLSTNELQMTGGEISIDTAKAMSLDIKGKTTSSLVDNGRISVAGKMSVAGNLELAGASSSIRLYDPSGKNKAMPLAVKGSLTLGSGSTLTLSGALSAKDMVLDGGTINLTSTKLATIKVGNSLTLNAATDINYNFAVTQKDVDKGKAFKILTFKSSNLQGQDVESLYNLLGLSEEYCTLVWDKKQTSLSLKVTDLEGWNEAKVSDEDAKASAPAAVAALVNPVLPDYSGVADALVQANWGLVESSRAFVNAIGNRSMAVQLGSGERAVWASAIAGSSRRSSSGTHGGADTNITGGAIGMETQLGEGSLLGMALGNSWTRVSAHNYGTIKQDTTHLGIYGQTNWNKLSADWSAAYGRSESKVNGSDWSQKAIQLDGRLSYNHALSETVLLRGFGGVQYYASDSARVDGIDTGEVQNLRGEIGVGIVRSTYKSSVYAELALHQDLVRDNPEVRSPFGQRYQGTNPGRTGINFTIGGSYALSDQWSVNASYTAEVVENANAHSVNVGATYKF